jgi:hypothetical protein
MSTEWDSHSAVSTLSGAVNRHSVAKFPQCVVGITGLVLNRKVEENDNLEDEREASRMEIDMYGAIAPPPRHLLKERLITIILSD